MESSVFNLLYRKISINVRSCGLVRLYSSKILEKTFSESSELLKLILTITITATEISSHEKL